MQRMNRSWEGRKYNVMIEQDLGGGYISFSGRKKSQLNVCDQKG